MRTGSPGRGSRGDAEGLRQEIDRLSREQRRASNQPNVVTADTPLYIRSPNGIYFALQVDDAGVLSTISIGPSL